MIGSKLIQHILAKRGLFVTKAVSKETINELFRSFHPYQINFDLIRLGPDGDGGYLVPDDLEDIEACFSPGVDIISEFELDCLNYGMKLFMADKSVDRPNLDIPETKYSFLKKYVGCTNNEEFITLDKWVESSNLKDDSDLLLQMDIEGGEFESLIHVSDSLLNRFRIMVIEFHFMDALWDPGFYKIAKALFDKILHNHTCIHIHPNNQGGVKSRLGIDIPMYAEFTFIRNDRIKTKEFQSQFPHKLDFDNSKKAHIPLPKEWYKSY